MSVELLSPVNELGLIGTGVYAIGALSHHPGTEA